MKEYDVHATTNLALRNGALSVLGLLGSTTMTWALFATPSTRLDLKALFATMGLGSSLAGIAALHSTREMLDIRSTFRDVSRVVRANNLYERMSQPTLEGYNPFAPFDWLELKRLPDLYPHIMLLGNSGGGKSTLAENLAGLLQPALVYGVLPHWQAGEFGACDRLVATGRNIGSGLDGDPTASKPLYTWADIQAMPVEAHISACELLHALYWEMHRRYQLDQYGQFTGANDRPIVVILDEYLAYAKLPGVDKVVKALVREARKVGIRLVFLVQGDNVASLGWDGEGDLRENLTYVRLGEFARQHLDKCYNRATTERKPYYEWARQEVKQVARPCMVEDEYAVMPLPGTYKTNGTPILQQSETISTPVPGDSAQPVQLEGALPQTTVPHTQPPATDILIGYDEVILSLSPEQLDKCLKGLWETAYQATSETMPSGRHHTRESIIKKVWGYESSSYSTGKVLWVLAEQKYGRLPLKE